MRFYLFTVTLMIKTKNSIKRESDRFPINLYPLQLLFQLIHFRFSFFEFLIETLQHPLLLLNGFEPALGSSGSLLHLFPVLLQLAPLIVELLPLLASVDARLPSSSLEFLVGLVKIHLRFEISLNQNPYFFTHQ